MGIATNCLICGDSVRMEHNKDFPKICNMCKETILTLRKACFPENCPREYNGELPGTYSMVLGGTIKSVTETENALIITVKKEE